MRHLISTLGVTVFFAFTSAGSAMAQDDGDDGFFEGDPHGSEYGDANWVEDVQGPRQEPEEEVGDDYFLDKLAPYGQWIWTPEYRWVWQPSGVAAGWRPFTHGHWVYSDFGWTWSSSFPWGWAAFHYGSWAFLHHLGWVWVPGTIWSPARVIWRYSGVHVGWAPILAGYDYWYGWSYYPVIYAHWNFVAWRHFGHRHPHHHYVTRRRVKDVFRHTYYPRRCRDAAHAGCHRGPARKKVMRILRRDVPLRRVENLAHRVTARSRPDPRKLGVHGDRLRVFRPKFQRQHRPTRGVERTARPSTRPRTIDLGEMRSTRKPTLPSRPGVQPSTRGIKKTHGPNPEIRASKRPQPGATIQPRRPSRPSYSRSAPTYRSLTRPKSSHKAPSAARPRTAPTVKKIPSAPNQPKVRSSGQAPRVHPAPKTPKVNRSSGSRPSRSSYSRPSRSSSRPRSSGPRRPRRR